MFHPLPSSSHPITSSASNPFTASSHRQKSAEYTLSATTQACPTLPHQMPFPPPPPISSLLFHGLHVSARVPRHGLLLLPVPIHRFQAIVSQCRDPIACNLAILGSVLVCHAYLLFFSKYNRYTDLTIVAFYSLTVAERLPGSPLRCCLQLCTCFCFEATSRVPSSPAPGDVSRPEHAVPSTTPVPYRGYVARHIIYAASHHERIARHFSVSSSLPSLP